MELVQKLEVFRLEEKMSQQELAAKLGVAFSTVNRWFNGKSQPNKIQSYHIRKLLERHFQVPVGNNSNCELR